MEVILIRQSRASEELGCGVLAAAGTGTEDGWE